MALARGRCRASQCLSSLSPCCRRSGRVTLVAGLVTRLGNVPINFQVETWDTDALQADFLEVQQRWWTFHVVRCAGLALGLGSLILAVLTREA